MQYIKRLLLTTFLSFSSLASSLYNMFLAILLATFLLSLQLNAEQKHLQLAIFPYLSPAQIIKHNKNLKIYLTKKLKRPISLITARNIKVYINNIRKANYDLIYTPPHVGRMANVIAGYQPIALTKQRIQGYFIVKKNSTLKDLSQTKGMTISMPSPMSIIYQIAVNDFKNAGIIVGKDIKHISTKGHTNAIFELIKGKSDLALSGVSMWQKLPQKYKSKLKIFELTTTTPGFIFMGNKNLDATLVARLKALLLKFDTTDEGIDYVFKGYQNVDDTIMRDLDQYTHDLIK